MSIEGQVGGVRRIIGIPVVGNPTAVNTDLQFDSTINAFVWVAPAAGGEANTASNDGAGAGLAKAKVGVDLPFKSVIGTAPIGITDNVDDVTITTTAELNTMSNVGGEKEVFKAKTGVDFALRTLKAGTNITLTENADDILIDAAGGASLSEVEFLQGKDAAGKLRNISGTKQNATGIIVSIVPPVATTTVIYKASCWYELDVTGRAGVDLRINAVTLDRFGSLTGQVILEDKFDYITKGAQLIGDGAKTIEINVITQANSSNIIGSIEAYDL